jgi:hypothetical protein
LVGELRAAGIASYNAGVDGTGTFNEVHLLRDHLRNWRGHIVVVAFFSVTACTEHRHHLRQFEPGERSGRASSQDLAGPSGQGAAACRGAHPG